MIRKIHDVCVMGLISLMALSVCGQTTVGVPDTYDATQTNTFDVVDGTVVTTEGVLVVFEGQLTMSTNIVATLDGGSGKVLASTQLYVQMALFDDLPEVNAFTNSQAAVLALLDESSATEGTLYALSDVGGSAQWLQLTNNVTDAPIAVLAGATNLITIVLRYPDGESYTAYEYTVSLSSMDDPSDQETSQVLTSPVTGNTGITGLSLVGEGAIASLSSTSGDPAPLSSRVDFSVYFSNGEFIIDIYTVDENGAGQLEVYAMINGLWVLIGTADAVGSGSNHYQLSVSGLEVGQSYRFKVIDEEGRTHLSHGEIEVKSVVMQAVQLDLETFIIQFNSEIGKTYRLLLSSDVGAPLADWEVASVQVNGPDGWCAGYMQEFQGMSEVTQIRVPRNRNTAFFKIVLVQ